MKACIIGKGSIGKKHFSILSKQKIEVFFVRRKKKYKTDIYFSELKNHSFDYFFITNPTSLHLKTLKRIIGFKKPIFIEKPFCNKKLTKEEIKYFLKHKIFVGFMLRYDKRIQKLKKIIRNKTDYSKIVWQTCMPKWHPNENYKKSYASRKDLGGGVVLTCSHEIDLSIYLFGNVIKVSAFKIKNRLKMDVEDRVQIILEHSSGQISEIFLDFTSQETERKIRVYLKQSIYEWDFFKNYLLEHKKNKAKKIKCKYKGLNETYLLQTKDILKNINTNRNRISLKNTLNTQLTIEAIFKSLSMKKTVTITKYPHI